MLVLSGTHLGVTIGTMLIGTTYLYLNHDESFDGAGPQQRVGRWSPPTGEFNWCEEDYLYTEHVAEVWNSLTSLAFCIGPALLWGRAAALPTSCLVNLALVAAIGLGSVVFHATLKYEAQLLDELPMLCYISHTVFQLSLESPELQAGSDKRSRRSHVLALCLAAVCAVMLLSDQASLPHRGARLVMVLCFSGCFLWLAFHVASIVAGVDEGRDSHELLTAAYGRTVLVVLIAIFAWMADNLGCRTLRSLPYGLPYPHFHAVPWHFGMSYVTYFLCRLVIARYENEAAARDK
eukprot:COSAG05_NODE_5355_length_1198_cov_10.876638_1_plen_292_part_00